MQLFNKKEEDVAQQAVLFPEKKTDCTKLCYMESAVLYGQTRSLRLLVSEALSY
jgi:hypothetical protein